MDQPPVKETGAQGPGRVARLVGWIEAHPAVLFAALVCVASVLRFQGAGAGLPYCWHPDEPKLINKGIEMLQSGDLNPHWFHYPTLPIYLQALGAALGYLDRVGSSDFISISEIPTGAADNLVHTIGDAHIWERGRKLTGVMGGMAAGFTMLAGRRLFTPMVGLLAGLFVVFSPVHIVHSALITVDVPTSMGVSLLLLASAWVYTRGSVKDYLLASLTLGLVIGFKYNAAVGALTPLAAWVLSERRQERLGLGLVMVPLGLVVFLLSMPFALVEPEVALNDMAKEVNHYMVKGHGAASIEPGVTHLLAMFRSLAVDYLPVALLGLLGLPLIARTPKWRAAAVVAAFPLAYMAYMSGSTVFFKRNLVVLVPAFALLCAAGVEALHQAAQGKVPAKVLSALVGVLVLVPVLFGVNQAYSARKNLSDSRSEMTAWLHEQPGWVVAVPVEMRIDPRELQGIDWVEVKFNDGPEGWREAGATHVLGGERLKVSGTRNTPIKGKAAEGAVAWYKTQDSLQTFGYTGWMLDMNAQDPEISVYALDESPKSSEKPAAAAGEEGGASAAVAPKAGLDRWQITPKKQQDKVTLDKGVVVMQAEPSVRSVKACEVQRTQVKGDVHVLARWRYDEVGRENMAGQLQARFFASDGGFIDGSMVVLDQASGSSEGWVDVDETVPVPKDASKLRLCIELGSDQGELRVQTLKVDN